jgi:hypothetical protein
MSERALKALFGTVVGLCLLWLVISFLPGGNRGPGGPSGALAEFFDGISPENVSAIRFLDPGNGGQVELSREGGQWYVNGFRTDSANLARFWEAMDGAKVGDLVASNPENHSRMGVAADSALTLEVETPVGFRSLLVGNPGARYGTAFIRLPSENDVHLLEGNVRPQVTRSLDDWRNKRVSTVDTAGVSRIEVERKEGGFILERSDSLWILEDGTQATAATVRGILGEMARLDASGFYEPDDSLTTTGGSVRALDEEGNLRLILEMGSGEGDRWVRVAGDSITYRVASWRAGRLLPGLDQVKEGG